MTDLETRVAALFSPEGALARSGPGLRHRPGQSLMAVAVAQALVAAQHLVVEAGTGVGKTYAYLAPLLLSGRRAVLSTATQALQDQLFWRDIPAVTQALGRPVRVALLKGRSSYVCLQRVEQARQGLARERRDPALAAGLEQVHRWAVQSERGDLAELPGLEDGSPLRPLISSTQDNCLGAGCPQRTRCHVDRARAVARDAEWIVVNHHLLLSDQLAGQRGLDTLLPPVDVVVLDEAHRLSDTATQLLGRALGSSELEALAREVVTMGTLRARGLQPWAHLALSLEQAARSVAQLCHHAPASASRRRWAHTAPEGMVEAGWQLAAVAVAGALRQLQRALAATAEASVELHQLHAEVGVRLSTWLALNQPSGQQADVRWLEWGGLGGASAAGWRLVGAPSDTAPWFRSVLGAPAARPVSWVFTSATLGGDDSLGWFINRSGLQDRPGVRVLRIPSPFDFHRQASLYVPSDLPEPADALHTPALAEAVARWACQLGGRTLVLTTTLRAAQRLAAHLRWLVEQRGVAGLEVLDPGRTSKRALLARFRAAPLAEPARAAVLVASMGFWEGVDLPGDTLQLLVLDKLPFPPPDDPLIEARSRASEDSERSAFDTVHIPECIQALQQGAGRLIRSETDRGVLVIADRRLLTRSYGPRLLGALPPMPRLVDEADMRAALDGLLTRPSTTDLSPT